MFIEKIIIENYKSFFTPQEIALDAGINVVIGKNNAGKTALVEALSFKFDNKPHLSLETLPQADSILSNSISTISCVFNITTNEFRKIIWETSKTFYIQMNGGEDLQEIDLKVREALKKNNIKIKVIFRASYIVSAKLIGMDNENSHDLCAIFQFENSSDILPNGQLGRTSLSSGDFAAHKIAKILIDQIFHFRAERFNIGQSPIDSINIIKPDASNLAQVLHLLQTSNPSRFERLTKLTKIIFPDIKDITIPPSGIENQVKVLLWLLDRSTERSDLALPLQESGTAIGQVLSILYVAINSENPRPIIIDEPQSFLHPSALRKLMEILSQELSKHQYIVTTHSPLLISASNTSNIILLQKQENFTTAKTINYKEKEESQILLSDVGARLSDVFGADSILWVEGATEEKVFPLILKSVLERSLMGISILGVLNVGDLEGKHKELIIRIYKKLSEGQALIPPAIGFILDKEDRTQSEQEDITREGKGKVYFLPKRMYENYLIHSSAIIDIVNKLEMFSEQPIEKNEIEDWIKNNFQKNSYYKDKLENPNDWLLYIHGANFLRDLFKYFSQNKYTYDKVRDGASLTLWLIENNPEALREVAELISAVLDQTTSKEK